MRHSKIFIGLVLIAATQSTFALGCSGLSSEIEVAQRQMKNASHENNLVSAQYNMLRAKRALENSALLSTNCGCSHASMALDDAAKYARDAEYAIDFNDFKYQFSHTIKALNSAIDMLNSCTKQS